MDCHRILHTFPLKVQDSVKAVLRLVCDIFVISFKNVVLLGGLGSRKLYKKNYFPYLIHFGVILQHTYVATFLSLHIWT